MDMDMDDMNNKYNNIDNNQHGIRTVLLLHSNGLRDYLPDSRVPFPGRVVPSRSQA